MVRRGILYFLMAGAVLLGGRVLADDDGEDRRPIQPIPQPTPSPQPPSGGGPSAPVGGASATNGQYVILAWNDLGMHCISPRFKEMAILPPANNFWAVVIRRGEEPRLSTNGLTLTYALDNTQNQYKTDFWQYAPQLFGISSLPVGTGLTGNRATGTMKPVVDHFEATAVPALPYTNAGVWNPFQHVTVKVTGTTLSTTAVIPVSDELNCGKCHDKGGAAYVGAATLESNILTLHDVRNGTKLMASRPVLCASCHSDNALKAAGKKGVSSLSLAMHGKHSTLTAQPTCYDCHPGAKTQCNRSAIPAMGPKTTAAGVDPQCATCHGNLVKMTDSLKAGRQPWLQEPTCAQCHGVKYATGNVLYRNAKGHGGIYCVACHNSPHAWYPSKRADDNAQPQALQGNTKAIGYKACFVCHTDGRTGTMPPHGGDDGGGD